MLTVLSQPEGAVTTASNAPCCSCHQACCRDYIVTVSGYDAWVLARRYGLALDQVLICCSSESDGDGEHFRLDHSNRRYAIALAKKANDAGIGWCSFWMPFDGGYGRCGVYDSRPLVCRTYPFEIEAGVVRVRENALCPVGAWQPGERELDARRRMLAKFEMERGLYCYVVSVWNDYVESFPPAIVFPAAVYYGYLTATYDRIDQFRSTMSAADAAAWIEHWERSAANGIDPLDPCEAKGRAAELVERLRAVIEDFRALSEDEREVSDVSQGDFALA